MYKKLYSFILFYLISMPVYSQDSQLFTPISQDFIDKIDTAYPEREQISNEILDASPEGLFSFSEDSEVFATFINEGAGYRNTFGFFTLNEEREISSKNTLFKNASKSGSGGNLSAGDTVSLGTIEAGTEFGFFLGANAYRNRWRTHEYYTYTPLNPDGIRHSILTYDYQEEKLVIGFEDLYNGGDKDYNDLIVTIFSNPTKVLQQSSRTSGVIDINGRQMLNSVTGMVKMKVAPFARVQLPDEIVLYPEDLSTQQNITFSGISEFLVESNTGVIISANPTPLSNGVDELFVNYQIDGNPHSFYTPQDSKHKAFHVLKLSSFIENLSQVEAQDYTGNITLTLAVY